ncbi:MAG: sulfite exporter TauE/SafE family protein [Candidatus Dormibacteria bacterium]
MEAEPLDPRPAASMWVRLCLVGLAGGFMSGFLGVGGGVVMVPALVWACREVQVRAHALSLAAIIPIAIVGTAGYAGAGLVDWRLAAILAAGSLVGAYLGAELAGRISGAALRRIFAIALGLVGVTMLLGLGR